MLKIYKLLFIKCVFEVVLCTEYCEDSTIALDHGSRSPPMQSQHYFFNGAKIRYYCDSGYGLTPSGFYQVCLFNESKQLSWQPQIVPTCTKVLSCGQPPEIEHSTNHASYDLLGNIELNFKHSFKPGTKVYYYCTNGYYLDPGPPFIDSSLYPALVCKQGQWKGDNFRCVKKCSPLFTPFDGYLVPEISEMGDELFAPGFQVEYRCWDGSVPHGGDIVRVCGEDGNWNGTEPTCKTSTTSLPINSSMTCSRPEFQSDNLHWICCDIEESSHGVCCPSGAHIQFLCDEGYEIDTKLTQMICYNGFWSLFPPPKFQPIKQADIPHCIKKDNVSEVPEKSFSHEMMGPVVATAIAVLFVLLIATFLTFRPKLRDIKRRWLEKKKRDDEVIINGQRIQLPTYQEAVSSQPYQVLCNSVSCESLQGTSSDDIAQNIDEVFIDEQNTNNSVVIIAGPEPSSQIVINETQNYDSSNIDNDALCDILPTSSQSRNVKQIRDTGNSDALNSLSSFPLMNNTTMTQQEHIKVVDSTNVQVATDDTVSVSSGTCLLNSTDEDVLMTSLHPIPNQQNADSTTV